MSKNSNNHKCNNKKSANGKSKNDSLKGLFGDLSPEQIAVIAALITKSLSINSITLDKDQKIEVVLSGSLKQKTKMDKLLEEASSLTISDLLDSIKNW